MFKDIQKSRTKMDIALSYGSFILITILCVVFAPDDVVNLGVVVILPIVYLFFYALFFKRILEGMFFAVVIAYALGYKSGLFYPFMDGMYTQFANPDFVWILLLSGLFNVFMILIQKAGCLESFVGFILKRAKTERSVKIWTWILAWPMFIDEYLHVLTLNRIMYPIYDKKKIPREELALITHAMAAQIRVIFPITTWAALLGGLFESGGLTVNGSGLFAFFKTIPFNFYAWVSIIGALLFALGIIPKFGKLKACAPTYEEDVDVTDDTKKKGTLFDFFAPIVLVIIGIFVFDYDAVPSLIVALPIIFGYFMLRGLIEPEDIEECLVEGFKELMYLFVLFLATYMLTEILEYIGFMSFIIDLGQRFLNPKFLPVILFLLFSLTEFPMSLGWGLFLIVFPVIIPLAVAIGANPYLAASAVISAVIFGGHGCFICDYTVMTSQVLKMKPYQHAITQLPFVLVCGAITAVLYLIAGFVF